MAYTSVDFPTKKALKEAIKAGQKISVFSPGPFRVSSNGTVFLEGPHAPQAHSWYAQAKLVDGYIVKVK